MNMDEDNAGSYNPDVYLTIMVVSFFVFFFGGLTVTSMWRASTETEAEKTKQLEIELKIEQLKHGKQEQGK